MLTGRSRRYPPAIDRAGRQLPGSHRSRSEARGASNDLAPAAICAADDAWTRLSPHGAADARKATRSKRPTGRELHVLLLADSRQESRVSRGNGVQRLTTTLRCCYRNTDVAGSKSGLAAR